MKKKGKEMTSRGGKVRRQEEDKGEEEGDDTRGVMR